LNFDSATRRWMDGSRLGGSVTFCGFYGSSARSVGAFLDFAWKPSKRLLSMSNFFNNSADIRSGGFCAFHIMHLSSFINCSFAMNFCPVAAASIYVESTDSIVELIGCTFQKSRTQEIGIRFHGSEITVQDDCVRLCVGVCFCLPWPFTFPPIQSTFILRKESNLIHS
jgi:hypothetical protein